MSGFDSLKQRPNFVVQDMASTHDSHYTLQKERVQTGSGIIGSNSGILKQQTQLKPALASSSNLPPSEQVDLN